MQVLTLSILSAAPAEAVYAFASNPANLPLWAAGFCRSIQQHKGRWVVDSPLGEVDFSFVPENPYGVLDHTVVTANGRRFYNPMRVIAAGEGSVILFTLLQAADSSLEDLERDAKMVRADLETLARRVEAKL